MYVVTLLVNLVKSGIAEHGIFLYLSNVYFQSLYEALYFKITKLLK